jgi:hypothetical protein
MTEHGEADIERKPQEPAIIVGTGVALVTIVLDGLLVLGFDLRTDVQMWLVSASAFIAPLVAAAITRAQVYSPQSVEHIKADIRTAAKERSSDGPPLAPPSTWHEG